MNYSGMNFMSGQTSAFVNIVLFFGSAIAIAVGAWYINKYPDDSHSVADGLIVGGSIILFLQICYLIYRFTRGSSASLYP